MNTLPLSVRVDFGKSMLVTCGYEGVDDVGAGFVLDGFARDDIA